MNLPNPCHDLKISNLLNPCHDLDISNLMNISQTKIQNLNEYKIYSYNLALKGTPGDYRQVVWTNKNGHPAHQTQNALEYRSRIRAVFWNEHVVKLAPDRLLCCICRCNCVYIYRACVKSL